LQLESVAGDFVEAEVDLGQLLTENPSQPECAISAWEPASEEQYNTVLYKLCRDLNFVYCPTIGDYFRSRLPPADHEN
jgi:hypothetical protein